MNRQRWAHPKTESRSWVIAVVTVALVACTAPVGSVPSEASGVIAAATPSIEPSAALPADATAAATPSPTLEPTPPLITPPAFTWQRHVLPGLAYRSAMSYRDGFIALGPAKGDEREEVSVLRSEDGLTWRTLARRPFDGQIPASMTLIDDRLIVSAWRILGPESAETVVWSSNDGKSWEVWMKPPGVPHFQNFARIGDRWLMVSGYGDGIQSSLDGIDWTTELPLHPAAEGPGFAVGPGGVIAPVTQEGESGPGRSWMYMGVDGTEWTEATFDDAANTWIGRAAASETGYVAMGLGSYQTFPSVGRAWWSAHGETWERSVVPDDFGQSAFYPKHITSYGSGFLATVNPQEEGPQRMLWSSDGRAWQYVDGGPDVLYEGTGLVVDHRRVLLFGEELNGPDVRTLWEATPAD